jgi:hypothetical protein
VFPSGRLHFAIDDDADSHDGDSTYVEHNGAGEYFRVKFHTAPNPGLSDPGSHHDHKVRLVMKWEKTNAVWSPDAKVIVYLDVTGNPVVHEFTWDFQAEVTEGVYELVEFEIPPGSLETVTNYNQLAVEVRAPFSLSLIGGGPYVHDIRYTSLELEAPDVGTLCPAYVTGRGALEGAADGLLDGSAVAIGRAGGEASASGRADAQASARGRAAASAGLGAVLDGSVDLRGRASSVASLDAAGDAEVAVSGSGRVSGALDASAATSAAIAARTAPDGQAEARAALSASLDGRASLDAGGSGVGSLAAASRARASLSAAGRLAAALDARIAARARARGLAEASGDLQSDLSARAAIAGEAVGAADGVVSGALQSRSTVEAALVAEAAVAAALAGRGAIAGELDALGDVATFADGQASGLGRAAISAPLVSVDAGDGCYEHIAAVCRARFLATVTLPSGVPTLFDNAPASSQPPFSRFVAVYVMHDRANQKTIGGPSYLDRKLGALIASVHVPIGAGDSGEAWAYGVADLVVAGFRAVSDSGLLFGVPSVIPLGPSASWYRLDVITEFRADEEV